MYFGQSGKYQSVVVIINMIISLCMLLRSLIINSEARKYSYGPEVYS